MSFSLDYNAYQMQKNKNTKWRTAKTREKGFHTIQAIFNYINIWTEFGLRPRDHPENAV